MAKKGKEMASGQISDGDSPAIEVEGYNTIFYEGGFGAGTPEVKLQISRDGLTNWNDVENSSKTEAAQFTIFTPRVWIRTNLTGATATTATLTTAAVPAAILTTGR